MDTDSSNLLARLDARVLFHANNIKHLRSVYKKKKRRSLSQLFALRRSRQRLHIRALETRRSIADTLPTEILSEIFSLVDNPAIDSLDVLRRTTWVLGRVCRRWRAIILDTPKLWSNITVDNADKRGWTDGRECLLNEILSRTRSCSLHVTFTAFEDDYVVMLLHLNPHRYHLSSFELTVNYDRFIPFSWQFLLFSDGKFPILESFSLHAEAPSYVSVDPPARVLFRHAPRLTRLNIEGINLASFPLPWTHIRKFTGDSITRDDFSVFKLASCLQEAHIISYQLPVLTEAIDLPSLRHLTLSTPDHPFYRNRLRCPNLESLRFVRLKLGYQRDDLRLYLCRGLDTFIADSRIHTLILDIGVHPFPAIHAVIQSCSSRLRVLSLCVSKEMATDLYTELVVDNDRTLTCLAPHLEELYIRDMTDPMTDITDPFSTVSLNEVPEVSAFMEPALVDMVASRVQGDGCLRELVLCARYPCQLSKDTQQVFQRLRDLEVIGGFKCTVHWGYRWTLFGHGEPM